MKAIKKEYIENEKGELVYNGKIYFLKNSKQESELIFKSLWLAIALLAIVLIAGGMIPFKGMIKDVLLTTAYGGEWIGLLLLFRSLVTLSGSRYKLIQPRYKSTIISFPIYEIIIFGFSILGIILSTVYVIKNGFDSDLIYFIIYIALKLACIVLVIEFKKMCNKLKYE